MTRTRTTSGFTLTELMVIVAIIGVVAALAARMYSGGVRGETAPAFARSVMATLGEARHMAVALGKRTRVTLAANPMRLDTDSYEPTTSTWMNQASLRLPSTLQLCAPDTTTAQIGTTVTPSCPLTTSTTLCFSSTGRLTIPSSGDCTSTTAAMTSATLFFDTIKGDKKYRVVIWGLTGMAKVIDTW